MKQLDLKLSLLLVLLTWVFRFTAFEGKGSAELKQGNSFNTNQNTFESWLQEEPFKKVCQGSSSPISSLC